MGEPFSEARAYVVRFLQTGSGGRVKMGERFDDNGSSYDAMTLGLACARHMNGLGVDPTASDQDEAARCLEFVRGVSRLEP